MKNVTYYEKKLLEERGLVIKELNSIGVIKNKKNPDDWEAVPGNIDTLHADSNEVADKIESYEENTAIVEQLENQLIKIDSALKKIKDGNYGLCEIGDEQIEEDRLEANPAATTCKKHINN